MKYSLKQIINKVIDNRGKNPKKYSSIGIPVIDNYLITNSLYPNLSNVNRYIDNDTYNTFIRAKTNENDVLITLVGNGYGNVTLSPKDTIIIQNTIGLRTNELCNQKFLYYLLLHNRTIIKNLNRGCAQPSIKVSDLLDLEFDIPTISEQQHIVNTIGSIDDLIENNNKIINNLHTQILNEYNNLKIKTIDSTLENEFDIFIGRTPPRNEKKWFENNIDSLNWVSIKDMGENNCFIYKTNEKITKDAINKFNYNVANVNDILLSFKLTVGKVSIAGTPLVTNEAIATFKPKKEYLRWYLYCYLLNCDFNNAGSTSSIATAINSSIIKKYKFPLPEEDSLLFFNKKVTFMFDMLNKKIIENIKLSDLKNSYLNKFFN